METLLLICSIVASCCADNGIILTDGAGWYDNEQCTCSSVIEVKRIDAYELLKNQKDYKGCIAIDANEYLEIK